VHSGRGHRGSVTREEVTAGCVAQGDEPQPAGQGTIWATGSRSDGRGPLRRA